MEIVIKREIVFRLCVHGRLLIEGNRVCDTLENLATCRSPGTYQLLQASSVFSARNGAHLLRERIAVGDWKHLGFLIRTAEARETLLVYIRQRHHRRQPLSLVIDEEDLTRIP